MFIYYNLLWFISCLRGLLSAADPGALRGDSEPPRVFPSVARGHRAEASDFRSRAQLQAGGE